MAVRKYKPTTPGRRGASVSSFDEITRSTPEKSLLEKKHRKAGRNVHGRITTRHQGGGTKQRYRVIDFRRNKDGVPAKVAHIEYDPNRSARIALLHYADGEKRYILAPQGVKQGDTPDERPRRRDPSRQRAAAAEHPGRHGRARDRAEAGGRRQARPLGGRERPAHGQGRLDGHGAASLGGDAPRARRRPRPPSARSATPSTSSISLGKAGRARWKNKRPTVRGVAMNPVDHPLGGGEGKSSGGRHPASPWGKKEGRTRKKNKASNKYIVRRRGKGRG